MLLQELRHCRRLFAVHTVIETADYLADAKAAGMTEDDRRRVVKRLAATPNAGAPIKGAGGARKVRVGGKQKGKSGGYRVITFYGGEDVPVFLLNVFSKGDRVNLSPRERNALAAELASLKADYLKGVAAHVPSRGPNTKKRP